MGLGFVEGWIWGWMGMEGLASRGTWRTCRGMHVEGGEVGSGETEELIPRTNMLRRGDG